MVWKPDYVTDVELRDYRSRNGETVPPDVFLAPAATAASRAVDRHTGRQFGKVDAPTARTYTALWDRRHWRYVVDVDDLYDATGLVVTVPAGPVNAFRLEPVNALADGMVYTRLVILPQSANQPTRGDEYQVTATSPKWGWPAVPATVKLASLMQGARLDWRRDAPAGVAGSPDSGSEVRLLSKLDPDVAVILAGYVRWWAAG